MASIVEESFKKVRLSMADSEMDAILHLISVGTSCVGRTLLYAALEADFGVDPNLLEAESDICSSDLTLKLKGGGQECPLYPTRLC